MSNAAILCNYIAGRRSVCTVYFLSKMSHRTSRWGRKDDNHHRQNVQKTISDDDAMKALLLSAETRSNEQEGRTAAATTGNKNFDSSSRRRRHENQRGGSVRGRGGSRWVENKDGDAGCNDRNKNSYYGPAGNSDNNINTDRKRKHQVENNGNDFDNRMKSKYATSTEPNEKDDGPPPPPLYKPNFGLSGALARDTDTGNVYKGVVLKFKEPPEARAPNTKWRLYVFKPNQQEDNKKKEDANLIETLHISKQSAYLFGRNKDIADIHILHPSLSGQHAVLQYRAMPVQLQTTSSIKMSCQPYIMDLESTNGTMLNGIKIDPARYYQLKKGDVLSFGASTREYILLTENTTSVMK